MSDDELATCIRRNFDLLLSVYPDDGSQEALDFCWLLAYQAAELGEEIRSPLCPRCDSVPRLVISVQQALCSTDDCQVFVWSMTSTAEQFEAEAETINLERGW